MGYHQEMYRQIREKYRTKHELAEAEANRRTAQLHLLSPELAQIDRQLSKTAAEIALAALGTGEKWEENLEAVQQNNLALQERRRVVLAELGYPADYTDPPYECPKCKDSGYVGIRMCECMRQELVYASFAASGLGDLIQKQSFENFDLDFYSGKQEDYAQMKRNFENIREYAETFDGKGGNWLFFGGTGLGKTHLSTALARRVMERGYDVAYTGAVNLFAAFEAKRFGAGREGGREDPARFTECDLLIIDDLGTEVTNQFTISCLYTILNNRLNEGRATVVSTNLSLNDLKSHYVERLASRLLGEFRGVPFTGTDIRLLKITKK